jgi:DNA-binding NarL/FixJ family response regulator
VNPSQDEINSYQPLFKAAVFPRPCFSAHYRKKEFIAMNAINKVVIAEDHQLFREGLRSMLSSRKDIRIVGEASDGLEAIRCIKKKNPEMLLLDISMPRLDGISVIKDLRPQFPDLKILVLTIHESDHYILETFKAGVNGYCVKDSSRSELLCAIDSVLAGKTYISPGIAGEVMEGYLARHKTLKKHSAWERVTQREREVLKLVAEGYTNKEIADFLNISVKTVEKHRANIMKKIGLHNVAALTYYAVQKGLVTPKV